MKENESSDDFAKTKIKDQHAKFFKYADEVLQVAKKNGRNTIPIEIVIAVRIIKIILDFAILSGSYKV